MQHKILLKLKKERGVHTLFNSQPAADNHATYGNPSAINSKEEKIIHITLVLILEVQ